VCHKVAWRKDRQANNELGNHIKRSSNSQLASGSSTTLNIAQACALNEPGANICD
jgi:hypothetical protein